MAFHCYNEVALRPMGDIDLVVPLDRIRDVEQLFQNMGANTHWPSKEQPIRTFSAIEILPISFDNGEFIYDIHWAFIPEYLNFGLNEAAMKTRAEIIEDKDHIYKILNPSDNLITTILHNEKNIISKGVRLSLLNDIRICLRITPMESISVESYSDSTRKSVSQHIEFYSNYFDGLLKPNLLETKLGRLIIKGRSTRVKSIGMVTYVMKQKTLKKGLVLLFNTAFPPLEFMQKNHNTRSKIVALLFYPVRLFNASIYLIRYIRTELKDKFVQ
jgi:hypothetical protein